jgi:hypothetical protein
MRRTWRLMADQVLDPERPELLLFLPLPNGEYRLVGVEYLQPTLQRNRTSGAVAPWISPSGWNPAEYEVVTPTPELFGQTFDGPHAGHIPTMPWHWDLHVWLWQPNPTGMFAPFNPAIGC